MDSFIQDLVLNRGVQTPVTAALLVILVAWSFIWKGFALWHSAKVDEKYWFVAILLLNTVGIAEIAYLFYFSKKRQDLNNLIDTIKSFQPFKLRRTR